MNDSPPHEQDAASMLRRLLLPTAIALHKQLSEAVALGQFPAKSVVLDLDDENYLRSMSAHDRRRYLQQLIEAADPRESRWGMAQTMNDLAAHLLMSLELKKLIPGSLVVGEEASKAEWNKCAAAPPGTLVWNLDAIDGSALQDTVGYGYSANVILYRKRKGLPAEPLMAVVVTSSSTMIGWIYTGQVGAAHLNSVDPHTGGPMLLELVEPVKALDQLRDGWVAVVAAQAKDRVLLRSLFDSELSIMTLGGAPALPGLLLEKLAAVVIPSPQTRHDAPLLPLAAQMGLHFIDIRSGKIYTDAEVRGFFPGLARPEDPDYKPIPAMVISRELLFGIELAAGIRSDWERGIEGGKTG